MHTSKDIIDELQDCELSDLDELSDMEIVSSENEEEEEEEIVSDSDTLDQSFPLSDIIEEEEWTEEEEDYEINENFEEKNKNVNYTEFCVEKEIEKVKDYYDEDYEDDYEDLFTDEDGEETEMEDLEDEEVCDMSESLCMRGHRRVQNTSQFYLYLINHTRVTCICM